jgi:hypothetical protein
MNSKQAAINVGLANAHAAIDQGDEFGSVDATIATYRENVIDTVTDEKLTEYMFDALCAFDDATNKFFGIKY